MGKARVIYGRDRRYFDGDEEVTQAEFDKRFPSKIEDLLASPTLLPGQTPSCWPMQTGLSFGILPHQIAAKMEADRKLGVPTEYVKTADGYAANPVFTDRAHRKAYHKAHGAHDNQGGYGD